MAFERRASPSETKQSIPKRIALDIDDTLMSPVSEKDLKKDYISQFLEKNLIITAIEPHIVHPGAIEFVRYLYYLCRTFNLTFCFFSHATVDVNLLRVPELLKRALCNKEYKYALNEEEYKLFEKEMKEKNIFSRDDCTPLSGGRYYKDLKKTLRPGDDLRSTILIDDQRSSLSNGQKANGLIIPYADESLFNSTFSGKWCSDDDFLAVNHIFYVTGLLDKVFSLHSKSITELLFELQYKEDGINHFWLYHQDIALVTFEKQRSLEISKLKMISDQHDNIPVLIKIKEKQEVIIFGKPNGVDWALTPLNPNLIKTIRFPEASSESNLFKKSRIFYEDDIDTLQKEIEDKKGHVSLKYEPIYDLYDDKSLYVNGLKILQQFATNDLNFYGQNANNFFGLKKAPIQNGYGLKNMSGYFSFWPQVSWNSHDLI